MSNPISYKDGFLSFSHNGVKAEINIQTGERRVTGVNGAVISYSKDAEIKFPIEFLPVGMSGSASGFGSLNMNFRGVEVTFFNNDPQGRLINISVGSGLGDFISAKLITNISKSSSSIYTIKQDFERTILGKKFNSPVVNKTLDPTDPSSVWTEFFKTGIVTGGIKTLKEMKEQPGRTLEEIDQISRLESKGYVAVYFDGKRYQLLNNKQLNDARAIQAAQKNLANLNLDQEQTRNQLASLNRKAAANLDTRSQESIATANGQLRPDWHTSTTNQTIRLITLDLNGDGQIKLASTPTATQMLNDGYSHQTNWIDSNDGILVFDRSGQGANNITTSGGQDLFADLNLSKDAQGIQSLRYWDANGDGRIDADELTFMRQWIGQGTWREMSSATH
jgi:hypothetical protein